MEETARDLLDQTKPWREDAKWPIVAAEAIILAALGLFMVLNTASAANVMLQIIGLVFLIVSLQVAIGSFRSHDNGLGAFDSFRAGIGVTAGIIATSLWWWDSIPTQAVRLILGWGLIAYAALQLIGMVVVRGKGGMRPVAMFMSALALALGILLLTSSDVAATDRVTFLGWVFLVFAALLAGLAFMIKSREPAAA